MTMIPLLPVRLGAERKRPRQARMYRYPQSGNRPQNAALPRVNSQRHLEKRLRLRQRPMTGAPASLAMPRRASVNPTALRKWPSGAVDAGGDAEARGERTAG